MKNTKKLLFTSVGVACLGLSVLCTPTASLTAEAASPTETVAPCSDVIQWRYKEENGKLWRRLYNYTTANWIGSWEYVADLT